MNKKELIEILNIIYSKSDNRKNSYTFESVINIDEMFDRVNNKVLILLFNIISNFKEDKIDTYRDKKISSIDLKLTILRAKIAELNNKKNDIKKKLSTTHGNYSLFSYEYDCSRVIHDLNLDIIDLSKQVELLQERRKEMEIISVKSIKDNFIARITKQNLGLNLHELPSYIDMSLFEKMSEITRESSPNKILDLVKKYKKLVDDNKKNSCINVIPVGEVVDYYPSLKLLSDLELPIKVASYLKSSDECENIIYSISRVQSTILRNIKQLIETEYTPEKIDGIRSIQGKINDIEVFTDYDFLRLHQGKYDNNLAIQLRGYEQIYESKQKQIFKTNSDLVYINSLKRQIIVLRKKIYGKINSWYLSQKQFNNILDFDVDSLDNYDILKDRYDKILDQLNNYKEYIIGAQNILNEIKVKYNDSLRECEVEASELGFDINLLNDMVLNYYSLFIDYVENESVNKQVFDYSNGDRQFSNEVLAEKIANNWTNNPKTDSIQFSREYSTHLNKKSA